MKSTMSLGVTVATAALVVAPLDPAAAAGEPVSEQVQGLPCDAGYDFLSIDDQDVASIGECVTVPSDIHVLVEQIGPPSRGQG
jgi:hypothetical protein